MYRQTPNGSCAAHLCTNVSRVWHECHLTTRSSPSEDSAAIDYVAHRSEDAVLHPTMHALASDMSISLPSVVVTLLLYYYTYYQTARLFVACLTSATLGST